MADMQVCAFHADEGISPVRLDDEVGTWQFTCDRAKGHPIDGPYTWISVPEPPAAPGISGLAQELNLHIELPAALGEHRGHWVEYGVVEEAYARRNPQDFGRLVDAYGHTAIRAKSYTASAYLARTLGDLSRMGTVLYHAGPATGRWSYNAGISWWTLPPEPVWSPARSWVDLSCLRAWTDGSVRVLPLRARALWLRDRTPLVRPAIIAVDRMRRSIAPPLRGSWLRSGHEPVGRRRTHKMVHGRPRPLGCSHCQSMARCRRSERDSPHRPDT